jgi:hypothetical protein
MSKNAKKKFRKKNSPVLKKNKIVCSRKKNLSIKGTVSLQKIIHNNYVPITKQNSPRYNK